MHSMQDSTRYTLDGVPIQFPENGSFMDNIAQLVVGNFSQAVYAIRQDITVKILDQGVIQDPVTKEIVYNLAQQDMIALGYYDASYLYATIDLGTDQWNGGVVFTSMFSIRSTPYEQVISFSTTEVQGNKVTIWARGSGFVNGHSLLVSYLIIPKN